MKWFKFMNCYADFNIEFHIQASDEREAWDLARKHKHFDPAKTEIYYDSKN